MSKPGLWLDQYHRYWYGDDGPIVGVTSILKLQDTLIGGDLAVWGANQAVDRILEGNITRDTMRDEALTRVRAASKRGTIVHAAIEQILAGTSPEPTVETSPYIYSFSSWLAATRPEFLEVERRIINRQYRYAGTFDFIARIDGRVTLVDVKSGRFKESFRLQLAGYAMAEGIGVEDDPTIRPMPRVSRFAVLMLRDNGYEFVPLDVTPSDLRHFLNLVKTYHAAHDWKESHNGTTPG